MAGALIQVGVRSLVRKTLARGPIRKVSSPQPLLEGKVI